MDCRNCPEFATCTQPCAAVEAQLPVSDAEHRERRVLSRRERERVFHGRRFAQALLDHRDHLEGGERRIVNLRLNHGMTYGAIAQRVKRPVAQVRRRWLKALMKLTARMRQQMRPAPGDDQAPAGTPPADPAGRQGVAPPFQAVSKPQAVKLVPPWVHGSPFAVHGKDSNPDHEPRTANHEPRTTNHEP